MTAGAAYRAVVLRAAEDGGDDPGFAPVSRRTDRPGPERHPDPENPSSDFPSDDLRHP